MKEDTGFITDRNRHTIATQSNPCDESEVSVNIVGGNFVFLNRDQVLELIVNLVTLLADLEE